MSIVRPATVDATGRANDRVVYSPYYAPVSVSFREVVKLSVNKKITEEIHGRRLKPVYKDGSRRHIVSAVVRDDTLLVVPK